MTNIFQMSWNHQPDLNKFPTKWVFHSTSRTQNPAVSALSAGEDMEEKKPVRILEMLFLKVLYKDSQMIGRNAYGCWWYQFYF